MGTIILIIIAVMEAALSVYCIVTKSEQKKVRSWVRIVMFAEFIIFTLLSVIQWGFKWMPLAAVLLILAMAGGVSLMRSKEQKKEFRAVPVVLRAIAALLIFVIAATPVLVFPQYKLPKVTGNYKVGTVVYTYTDSNRIDAFHPSSGNRRVNVEFWYPSDTAGRYPLVVFSHGAFGLKASNTSTFKELASNGYVVCSIDHPYHSLYTKGADGKSVMVDRAFLQEVIDVNNNVYDEKARFEIESRWMKVRTEDMNFVLDTILTNAKDSSSDRVYQLVDTSRLGLLGHSLGGAASAELGRERRDIAAVVSLDADLLGEEVGVVNGKPVFNHEPYPVPLLNIYSETMKALIADITDPDILREFEFIATSPKVHNIYIPGTNHMSVTDLPLVSPLLVNVINGMVKKAAGKQDADSYKVIGNMNDTVLKFFDCHLKGEGSFSEGLSN